MMLLPANLLRRRVAVARACHLSTLVFVEHKNGLPTLSSLSALTAARALAAKTSSTASPASASAFVSIAASDSDSAKRLCNALAGHVGTVYAARAPVGDAGALAPLLAAAVKEHGFSHVLAAGTAVSKDLLPRSAALLGVPAVSDVTAFKSATSFVRPIYAGNAVCELESTANPSVLLVRQTAFAPAAASDNSIDAKSSSAVAGSPASGGSCNIVELAESKDAFPKLELLPPASGDGAAVAGAGAAESEKMPELATARVVVAGGRALKSAENFKLVYSLAQKLNGAVGASRAAVDAGFADNSLQIGQTGKVVAPDLYIALGISGAIQHLAGMKDSKVIVAINNDAESPIFQVSDYGLVADIFEAVPELTKKLPDAAGSR